MNNSTSNPGMVSRAIRPQEQKQRHVVQVFFDYSAVVNGVKGAYRARLKARPAVHDTGAQAKDAFDNLRRTAVTFGYPNLPTEYEIELI